jgi:glycosyltransferase involved in cell wall biosynthesis
MRTASGRPRRPEPEVPLRIGLFTNNYRPLQNGLATSVDTFADAYRRAGHTVTVVAPRYPGGAGDEPGLLRVPGLAAPTHHAYVLPCPVYPGVARTVAALELDVYHAQHPFLLGAAARRWARRADRPLVFTYHTHYDRYAHYVPGPARLVARLAVAAALRMANASDLVVAPSAAVARMLRTKGVEAPVIVVPTGVPLPLLPDPTERERLRRRIGRWDGAPLCLSVGRLAPEKNLGFLLHAFASLSARCPLARLLLVGDGDDRGRLERLAASLGIGGRVDFVGPLPHADVVDFYLAADLFLFSSTSETQGLVALEAMAAALPVVAVPSEAAAELFGSGRGGVIAPEDAEVFGEAAARLWADRERRAGLGEEARSLAARYTPEASAATLLTAYARLIRGRQAVGRPTRVRTSREART